jgi:hypothetical protein
MILIKKYYSDTIKLKNIWNFKIFSLKTVFLISTENYFLKYSNTPIILVCNNYKKKFVEISNVSFGCW